jgi:transcriptional regulator with XRE-family HTH domain
LLSWSKLRLRVNLDKSIFKEGQMLIQKLRLQRGWSQEQLALVSGLSVRTIQRLERGESGSVESLKALGAVLEVDFSTLKEPTMNTTANPTVSPDEALALSRVRRLKSFYVHLAQFVVATTGFAVINILTNRHYLWFLLVAFGWGTGVLVHGLKVFDKVPFLSGEWERRQVEKQLGRKL